MKLRMIAECSARDLHEGLWGPRGNRDRADEISREQTAKNLVYIALRKLRNMLEPMGLLKQGSKIEPIHIPEISNAFNKLRTLVKSRASMDAERIIANEDNLESIGKFWGFTIPTGWYDVHATQRGAATADGSFDDWIRKAQVQTAEAPEGEEGYGLKAQALNWLAEQIFHWHR